MPSGRNVGGDVFGSLVSLDANALGSANGGKIANDLGPSLNALKTKQTEVMQQSISVAGIPTVATSLKYQGNGNGEFCLIIAVFSSEFLTAAILSSAFDTGFQQFH